MRAAGLEGVSAHGLLKSAAVRLAENDQSDHEIMAMGGWDTLKGGSLHKRCMPEVTRRECAKKEPRSTELEQK